MKDEILKLFGANLRSAEWSKPPEEVVDELLALILKKLPEKPDLRSKALKGLHRDDLHHYVKGFKDSTDSVRSILESGDKK